MGVLTWVNGIQLVIPDYCSMCGHPMSGNGGYSMVCTKCALGKAGIHIPNQQYWDCPNCAEHTLVPVSVGSAGTHVDYGCMSCGHVAKYSKQFPVSCPVCSGTMYEVSSDSLGVRTHQCPSCGQKVSVYNDPAIFYSKVTTPITPDSVSLKCFNCKKTGNLVDGVCTECGMPQKAVDLSTGHKPLAIQDHSDWTMGVSEYVLKTLPDYMPIFMIFKMTEDGQFAGLFENNYPTPLSWSLSMVRIYTHGEQTAAYLAEVNSGFVVDPFEKELPLRVNWGEWLQRRESSNPLPVSSVVNAYFKIE